MARRNNRSSSTVPATVTNQKELDAKLLNSIVSDDRFARGGVTFNVNYTVSAKALGTQDRPAVTIKTPNGIVTVPATIMSLIGAAMDVSDFHEVNSVSGKSKVWTSKTAQKRIADAGFMLTKWNKLRKADSGDTSSRAPRVVEVVNPAAVLGV